MLTNSLPRFTLRETVAIALLVVGGLIGNYVRVPLFFGVDFLFGSIATWLILLLYGTSWGTIAAAIISLPTIILWGHPYAIILFILETFFVGKVWQPRQRNLVLIDGLYWLCLGIPLVGLFYGWVMQLGLTQVLLILLKAPANGIFNALIANLLVAYLPLYQWIGRPHQARSRPLQQILLNSLLVFALLPVLLLMILNGRWTFQAMENQLSASLTSLNQEVVSEIRQTQEERLTAIAKVGKVAQQVNFQPNDKLQQSVEVLQQAFPAMVRVYITDEKGKMIAAAPPVNPLETRTLMSVIACDQKPVTVNHAAALLQMQVALGNKNSPHGCAIADLKLSSFRQQLLLNQNHPDWHFTLFDDRGQIIATTHQNLEEVLNSNDFIRDSLKNSLERWLPNTRNQPIMRRWKNAFYIQEQVIDPQIPWRLRIKVPVFPYLETLQKQYIVDLAMMLAITVGALLLSELISRRLINPLKHLTVMTTNLPHKLRQEEDVVWINSPIREIESLVINFQLMASVIREQFRDLQNVNETLEKRVQKRTQELFHTNEELIAEIIEREAAEQEIQRQYQRSQLLADVTLKIRNSLQLEEILTTAVTEVKKVSEADRVLLYQVFPDGTGKTISEAVVPGYPSILGITFPEEVFPRDYQQLYAQGRVTAINDIHASDAKLTDCLIEFVGQWRVQAKLIVPIFNISNSNYASPIPEHLWGLLIVHQCNAPRKWTEVEINWCQQLANQISIAISQAQLLNHLGEMVAQQTSQLTISNRKLQQEICDRLEIEQTLSRQEQQLRLITDALPVLIAYIDPDLVYRFNNRAYEDWLEKPRKEITGHSLPEVLGADFYQQIKDYIDRAFTNQTVSFELETHNFLSKPRWISGTYIPHTEGTPEVKGIVALVSDISDRKAMERMKDEFISVVSHELRTPLTSMHGSLQLLVTGKLGNLSVEGQQMLQIAQENTERLVRLVKDILDLQRIESGKISLKKQSCNTLDLMLKAIQSVQGMAQKHQVILSILPVSIPVLADPDAIIQTLTNLLSNAIKFSNSNSTVWLSTAIETDPHNPSHRWVLFKVQDEGRGIPADKLDTIFGRFQQVDASDSREKGGTGLGLAICRKIVEQHGGQIWAESILEKGSTFYFTLQYSEVE